MSEPLPINDHITIPADELSFETARGGGAGGQHVNTTDSRVRLRWEFESSRAIHQAVKERIRAARPGMITTEGQLLVNSARFRSQHRNLQDARDRLVDLVRTHLYPPARRRATQPTRGSKRRTRAAKTRRSDVKKGRGKVRGDD